MGPYSLSLLLSTTTRCKMTLFPFCGNRGDALPSSNVVPGNGDVNGSLPPHCLPHRSFDGIMKRMDDTSAVTGDQLLAREMNKLSVVERNDLLDEIHGVAVDAVETPDTVGRALKEMREVLSAASSIKPKDKRAWNLAMFLRPTLEQDDQLLLFFLRGERSDPTKAARKLCQHFDHKLELFGISKLAKPRITLPDLSEDDMVSLRAGFFQVLGVDKSGRCVFIMNPYLLRYKVWQNQLRAMFYVFYDALMHDDDKQFQIKGIVDVIYMVGETGIPDYIWDFMRYGHEVCGNFCARRCSFHVCHSDRRVLPYLRLLQRIMGLDYLLRERYHFGGQVEVQYDLRGYGITLDEVDPYEGNEERMADYILKQSIKDQVWQEDEDEYIAASVAAGCIPYPVSPYDVLVGRGRPFQDYPGNLHMVKLVECYASAYLQATSRPNKTLVLMTIVNEIKGLGGNFLNRVEGEGWKVVSDDVAREKVGQSMRFRLKNETDGGQNNPPSKTTKKDGKVPSAKRQRVSDSSASSTVVHRDL